MVDLYVVIGVGTFVLVVAYLLIQRKVNEMKKLSIYNDEVVVYNKTILNKIEIAIFESKEQVLWMYLHYKELDAILEEVDGDDDEELERARASTKMNMELVMDDFINTFNMTPEEYSNSKTNMIYTTQEGESYPSHDIGIN